MSRDGFGMHVPDLAAAVAFWKWHKSNSKFNNFTNDA